MSAIALYCNAGSFFSVRQASRSVVRCSQRMSWPRSSLAPSMAAAFQASSAATSGRSFSCAMSVIAGSSAMLDLLRLTLLVPVDHALLPDVPQAGEHDADIHQHLPEPEHA